MAVVVSEGSLTSLVRPSSTRMLRSVTLFGGESQLYEDLWRTQPNVRTVVSFLARNIAQLGLGVFKRMSDTDRQKVADHPLAQLLRRPNPKTTRYRLMYALVSDMAIFDNAFWVKVKVGAGRGLVRIPPQKMEPVGDNWLFPDAWKLLGDRGDKIIPAEAVVHFHGYNPTDARVGISPLESLRRILAEEEAAADYREGFWRSGARISGVINRPAGAPRWSDGARERFRSDWQGLYSGDGPAVGGTPLLEDGMEFNEAGGSARDAQYIEARKLTREETAAAYHIPLPFVGILEHATFSNITEQHKNLYQDTLGPWCVEIEEEIELGLLPDLDDDPTIYTEFNIAEKLKGSFEDQAKSIQTLVGAPVLTRNEGRALLNRNDIAGGELLVTPLNVLVGGQASATDSAPKALGPGPNMKARPEGQHAAKHTEVLTKFFARQRKAVEARAGAKAKAAPVSIGDVWDDDRWNRELAADLFALNALTARTVAKQLAAELEEEFDDEVMLAWLEANASGVASGINTTTKAAVAEALGSDDWKSGVVKVFDLAESVRAPEIAETQVTAISGFASTEVAGAAGLGTKTWTVTSSNPRPSHAAMNGETVAIDETFSNGGRWPGDSLLSPDERAGCTCDLSYGRNEA